MAHAARGVGATGRERARAGRTGRTVTGRTRAAEPAGPPPPRPQELTALRARLAALVEPVVAREGLDLEEIAVSRMGRRYLIRVTVDADGGIGHDELTDVSRAVSAALDEAEERTGALTAGSYTLELSSPGVDRPLTAPRHWHRNVGRLVTVRIAGAQVTGRVSATTEGGVSLDVDGRRLDATFDELGPGRVQVEFVRLNDLTDADLGPEIADDEDEKGRSGA